MARVTHVKSARASKKPRRCVSCGHEVQPKESYKYVELKTGPYSSITRAWCATCVPKQSQLTANGRMSTLYGCQEALEDAVSLFQKGGMEISDLEVEFESQADEADSVADEYEESIAAMPDGLQQSSQAEEMQSKADAIHEWAEVLRGVNWPEFDPDACAECDGDRDDPLHDENVEEEYDHDFEEPQIGDVDISEAVAAIGELGI